MLWSGNNHIVDVFVLKQFAIIGLGVIRTDGRFTFFRPCLPAIRNASDLSPEPQPADRFPCTVSATRQEDLRDDPSPGDRAE
jgi:hypothetical protein